VQLERPLIQVVKHPPVLQVAPTLQAITLQAP
jgi:hypothetical protein